MPSKANQPQRDPVREERIDNEIIVDAYNEDERAGGWRVYLEDRLPFPFFAKCIKEQRISPLKQGEEVEAIGLIEESADGWNGTPGEVFVEVRWQERTLGVPLAQLRGIDLEEEAAEAIADWHYWVVMGYQY